MRTAPLATVLSVVAILLPLAACHHGSEERAAAHGPAHAPAHWGYTGGVAPENWSGLSPEYALCAGGSCQSPIDVAQPEARDLENPIFDYRAGAASIVNNGHTVQVNCDGGSAVMLDGKRYSLVQFHFHAPSEHRVGGRSYPIEMHLVHKAADGALAVVGVFITQGRENAAAGPIFAKLPRAQGPAQDLAGAVNPADLLPAVRTSYRYGGSLTTPPCSEGVSWTVMTTPIEMSPAQIKAFTGLYSGNNRPVQPLNGRVVVEDASR